MCPVAGKQAQALTSKNSRGQTIKVAPSTLLHRLKSLIVTQILICSTAKRIGQCFMVYAVFLFYRLHKNQGKPRGSFSPFLHLANKHNRHILTSFISLFVFCLMFLPLLRILLGFYVCLKLCRSSVHFFFLLPVFVLTI